MYGNVSGPKMGPYCPRVRGTSTSPRWETLTAHSLHEPQPNINQLPGLVLHTGMAVSTRGVYVFVPRVLGLYIYGTIHDPGMRRCRPWLRRDILPRGATLAARWLTEPRPTVNPSAGLGFSHFAGRHRPRGCPFSILVSWSCRRVRKYL